MGVCIRDRHPLQCRQDNFGMGLKYSDEATPKKQLMDGKEIIQDNVAVRTTPTTKASANSEPPIKRLVLSPALK